MVRTGPITRCSSSISDRLEAEVDAGVEHMCRPQAIHEVARERVLTGGRDDGVALRARREQDRSKVERRQAVHHQPPLPRGLEVARPAGLAVGVAEVHPVGDAEEAQQHGARRSAAPADDFELDHVADAGLPPAGPDERVGPAEESVHAPEDAVPALCHAGSIPAVDRRIARGAHHPAGTSTPDAQHEEHA